MSVELKLYFFGCVPEHRPIVGAYMNIVGEYQASIKAYPNPQGVSLTTFLAE